MPFLCVAVSQAARNQVRSGRWLPCSTVPAVTETCRSQAAHCRVSRPRASSQPLSCPQAGQRNPSGQRFSSSQRAQAASSGNRASNSGSDRGSSVISSPFMSLHATYGATEARGMSHFLILHEVGHICKNHNLGPLSDAQRRRQEHEADVFAMECLFSMKRGNAIFEPFRKMSMTHVCNLLSVMEAEFDASGVALDGYPSFKDRRITLLKHFA